MDNNKFDKLTDIVNELKIQVAKQDLNFEHLNAILLRLTESVEIHVRRSDNLEELVSLYKTDMLKEIDPIKSHISFIKGVLWTISGVGGVVVVLSQIGIVKF
jgi:hypothetical protein